MGVMRAIREKIEYVGTVVMIGILILAVLSLPIWLLWLAMGLAEWIGNG